MRRLPWRLASDELRVTGVEMERASPRGMTGKKASAPLPSAAPPPSPAGEGKNLWAHMLLACHPERAQRAEGFLKTICEKAKTALFAFSPYSGELHAERVNLRGIFILNNTQKEAKSHFCLFSLMSIRMEVNAARF